MWSGAVTESGAEVVFILCRDSRRCRRIELQEGRVPAREGVSPASVARVLISLWIPKQQQN